MTCQQTLSGRTIARVSKQRIGDVMAVHCHVLVTASRNVTRGHADVTIEDLASALDMQEDDEMRFYQQCKAAFWMVIALQVRRQGNQKGGCRGQ